MNYIVKNCPDYECEGAFYNCVNEHTEGDCQDCTNCVIKKIIELCKEESSIIQHKQKVKVKGLNKLADKIFELLDIEEVE